MKITQARRDGRGTVRGTAGTYAGRQIIVSIRATVVEMRLKHSGRVYRMPWAEVFDMVAQTGQGRMWTELVVETTGRGKQAGRAKAARGGATGAASAIGEAQKEP